MSEKKYIIEFEQELYGLQQEILDAMDRKEKKFYIAILGRQSGKSFLDKRICLEYSNNQGKRGMWIAPAISSARNHWQDITNMITASGLPVKKISEQAKEIHFYGGGFLSIRSAIEPDNIRGDSLDYIILDEAAFYRNGKYVWEKVCLPMITTTRGIMLMTTTPNGRNWVYDMYLRGKNDKDPLHKSWHMPSTKSPVQDKPMLQLLKGTMSEIAWRQEFMAEFLADTGGVFSGVKVAAVADFINAPIAGHTYVAGLDISTGDKEGDKSVFTVIDKYTRQQVYGKAFESLGTIKTLKQILELIDHWQPEKTFVEANGVGVLGKLLKELLTGNIDEDLIERMLLEEDIEEVNELEEVYKLKLVHMDNAIKREAVERLALDIEYGRLDILAEETDFSKTQINEMSTYQRQRTRSGLQITYNAEEGYHDDHVSALYLAYMGVPKVKPERKKSDKKKKNLSNPFKRGTTAPAKHRTGNRRL